MVLTGETSKLRTIIFTIEAYNGIFFKGTYSEYCFQQKIVIFENVGWVKGNLESTCIFVLLYQNTLVHFHIYQITKWFHGGNQL